MTQPASTIPPCPVQAHSRANTPSSVALVEHPPLEAPTSIELVLPWPPSNNTYWRHTKTGRHYIGAPGVAYKAAVARCVHAQLTPEQRTGKSRLSLEIYATPPDDLNRDLDNLPKAILDSLMGAGVFFDDGCIDRLLVERLPSRKGRGAVEVFIDIIGPPKKDSKKRGKRVTND